MNAHSEFSKEEVVETGVTPVKVSTVKLHEPVGGPPYTFETCLFSKYGSHVVDRYTSRAAAHGGHIEWVDEVRSGEIPTHLLHDRGANSERRRHTTEVSD